jgi:FMN reductase
MSVAAPVRVLCVGGSTRPGSGSESAIKVCAAAASAAGAEIDLITGRDLLFPIYDTETAERDPLARHFVEAVRAADALIIASPGYHGSMSGMLKNALDHLEDTRNDDRVYLDGMPVGCVAVAYGWQATVSTLHSLRVTVHALRGWPSPLGATLNVSSGKIFDPSGACVEDSARFQLETVAAQVVEFAKLRKAGLDSLATVGTAGGLA